MQIATFFNSRGGDRKYNAEHWANYFRPLFKTGVFNGGLQVVANGGMSVKVNAGYAWIDGYGYRNTDKEPLIIDLEVASGNLNRYDAIKIRLDIPERTIYAYAEKGENAASPKRPVNIRSDTVFELTIAEVYIAAGTTEITQSMITDTRMDAEKCGWVTGAVEQITFEQITKQFDEFFTRYSKQVLTEYQDYLSNITTDEQQATAVLEEYKAQLEKYQKEQQAGFESWVESLKDILSEEAVGNLQEEIGEMQKKYEELKKVAFTGSYDDLSNKPSIPLVDTGKIIWNGNVAIPVNTNVLNGVGINIGTQLMKYNMLEVHICTDVVSYVREDNDYSSSPTDSDLNIIPIFLIREDDSSGGYIVDPANKWSDFPVFRVFKGTAYITSEELKGNLCEIGFFAWAPGGKSTGNFFCSCSKKIGNGPYLHQIIGYEIHKY